MQGRLERGLARLALGMAGLAALAMAAIVGIIMTSVVMRKLLNAPLHITEEVVGLLLGAALFLGLPYVTLTARHVRVSIVADNLPAPARRAVRQVAMATGFGLFAWLLWASVPWFEFAFDRGLRTQTTRILLWPWMALLPLSLALTALIFLARLLGLISPERPGGPPEAADAGPSGPAGTG